MLRKIVFFAGILFFGELERKLSYKEFNNSANNRANNPKILAGMKNEEKNEKLNTETKPKKKINKKSVIIYTSIGVPIIAGGIIAGVLLGQNHFKVDAYGGLDATKLKEDYTEVYQDFQKGKKKISEYSDVEIANIALLKLNDVDNFYALTDGTVIAAGVTQNIRSTYIKNQESYFEESITESSFVKGANRFYQTEDVDWHKGKYINGTTGDYSKAALTEYTKDDFEEEWGRTLSRACIYIVNDKTYLDGSTTDNGDGTYTVDVNLDPKLSVLRYVKQMVMTGGLSQKPVFHEVKLKFVVDSDAKLLKFETYEIYDVHMVIDAKNSKGSLTQEYFYSERTIPGINEPTNYEK